MSVIAAALPRRISFDQGRLIDVAGETAVPELCIAAVPAVRQPQLEPDLRILSSAGRRRRSGRSTGTRISCPGHRRMHRPAQARSKRMFKPGCFATQPSAALVALANSAAWTGPNANSGKNNEAAEANRAFKSTLPPKRKRKPSARGSTPASIIPCPRDWCCSEIGSSSGRGPGRAKSFAARRTC